MSNKILSDSRLQAGTVPPQHRLSVAGIAGLLPNHSNLPRTLAGYVFDSPSSALSKSSSWHRLASRTRRHAPWLLLAVFDFTSPHFRAIQTSALTPTRNWAMITSAQATEWLSRGLQNASEHAWARAKIPVGGSRQHVWTVSVQFKEYSQPGGRVSYHSVHSFFSPSKKLRSCGYSSVKEWRS